MFTGRDAPARSRAIYMEDVESTYDRASSSYFTTYRDARYADTQSRSRSWNTKPGQQARYAWKPKAQLAPPRDRPPKSHRDDDKQEL